MRRLILGLLLIPTLVFGQATPVTNTLVGLRQINWSDGTVQTTAPSGNFAGWLTNDFTNAVLLIATNAGGGTGVVVEVDPIFLDWQTNSFTNSVTNLIASSDFVKKSGDTMSGALDLQTNNLLGFALAQAADSNSILDLQGGAIINVSTTSLVFTDGTTLPGDLANFATKSSLATVTNIEQAILSPVDNIITLDELAGVSNSLTSLSEAADLNLSNFVVAVSNSLKSDINQFLTTPDFFQIPFELQNVRIFSTNDNISVFRGTALDEASASNQIIYDAFGTTSTNTEQEAYAFSYVFIPIGLTNIQNVIAGFKHNQTTGGPLVVRFSYDNEHVAYTSSVTAVDTRETNTFSTANTFLTNNLQGKSLQVRVEASHTSTNELNMALRGICKFLEFTQP